MKKLFSKKAAVVALASVGTAVSTALAGASTGDFASIWSTISGWMRGSLGALAAGLMILVGIIAGIARQSLMSFVIGIGAGIGLYAAPGLIENIMSAVLPAATEATVVLNNGLV